MTEQTPLVVTTVEEDQVQDEIIETTQEFEEHLIQDPESRIQTIHHAHSSSYDETSEGGEAGETSSQTSSAKVAAAGVQRKASTASSSSKASSVASSSGAATRSSGTNSQDPSTVE